MKILFLGFSKIKYMPYLKFYLGSMSETNNSIHLLFWNRDGVEEQPIEHVVCHEYKAIHNEDMNFIKKVKNFIGYRKEAKFLIKRINPDRIVVLHTMPGVLVSDILCKHYDNKYLYDYRDYTYEDYAFFKCIVKALVRHSKATFVSSDRFRSFMPRECHSKIYSSHNINLDEFESERNKIKRKYDGRKIVVSYWGVIRDYDTNCKLIERLSNDSRFELHYYGAYTDVAKKLTHYCGSIATTNVFFHGEYNPNDRLGFAMQTDIIHNLFDYKSMLIAVSNKYYDGLLYHIPQLCMKGSYMGDMVVNGGVGFALSPYDSDFADELYNQYVSISDSEFDNNCENELFEIVHEVYVGKRLISEI